MEFKDKILSIQSKPLTAFSIDILQVNLGYKCNMACKHCHVQAGPIRKEVMARDTIEAVLRLLREGEVRTLDLTGGAPELNPNFKYLIIEARKAGSHILVRSNLTIFFESGMEDMFEFYRGNNVEIIASLPYYMEDNVDRVRGKGTFYKSIVALQRLNKVGYGLDADEAKLNLVYNPQGCFLPPRQSSLEEEYKKHLKSKFGISFNRLFTFANMPIGRFKNFLIRTGMYTKYINSLKAVFNPVTLEGIMCRRIINVGWDGTLYDCDFNQMLDLPINSSYPQHINDFDFSKLATREITVGTHCYACTAGQGST